MEDRDGKDPGYEANRPAPGDSGCGHSNECVQALDDMCRKYRALVYSTALRKIGDPTVAEDVTQEVLIKISRGRHALHPEELAPSYFVRVTENACTTWMSRRRPEEPVAPEVIDERPGGLPRPDWRVIHAEEEAILARPIAGLSPECAKVAEHFLEGYSTPEIAEALGKSEKAVEKQKTRMYLHVRAYGEDLRARWDGLSSNEDGGGDGGLMGYYA